jgi:hypothetical protein
MLARRGALPAGRLSAELAKAEAWLVRHRRLWEERLNALQRHLENEDE